MHYTYVLFSLKDKALYVGYSSDLKRRLNEHYQGRVQTTKSRRPLVLIYYESCLSASEARKREVYLKSVWGKRYLKNRLRKSIERVLKGAPVR